MKISKVGTILAIYLQRFVGDAHRCFAARLFFGGALFIRAFGAAILDFRRYLYLHIQAAFERGYLVKEQTIASVPFFLPGQRNCKKYKNAGLKGGSQRRKKNLAPPVFRSRLYAFGEAAL